jgi:hypothetical protein
MDFRKFTSDILTGFGTFEGVRRKDYDKENKASEYFLTISKWKSSLEFKLTEEQYLEWVSIEKQQGKSLEFDYVIAYTALVKANPEAVHISNKDKSKSDYNFVVGALDKPRLKTFELIEVEEDEL